MPRGMTADKSRPDRIQLTCNKTGDLDAPCMWEKEGLSGGCVMEASPARRTTEGQ